MTRVSPASDEIRLDSGKLLKGISKTIVNDGTIRYTKIDVGSAPSLVEYTGNNTVPTTIPNPGVDTRVLANGNRYDWNGTSWIQQTILTLDGNNYNVVATNATANVAPTALEVPSPINGDTATKFLTDNKIEYWAFTTVWNLIKTMNPTTLDGNDRHVVRVNAIANVAPTALEVATPMNGDTAKVFLTNNSIEYWSHNGTTWTRDTMVSASNDWALLGNAGTVQTTNFVGTTDNVGLSFRTNNIIRQTITAAGDVGIGTTTPTSSLHVNGSQASAIINITATTTLNGANHKVLVSNGATNITITFPDALTCLGREYILSRAAGSTGTITVQGTGTNIIQSLIGTTGATTSIGLHSATGSGLNQIFTAINIGGVGVWARI